jgi:hypothetical protein
MYIWLHKGLGQALGQHGLGLCDPASAGSMTFVNILATIACELQRKFTGPTDPRLLSRRRRLRELFNGVPAPKAKDLFDQLQQKSDPLAQLFRSRIATATQKEMLSILFFLEYDLRFEPSSPTAGVLANPRMTAAQKTNRIAQVLDAVGKSLAPPPDHLIARRDDRARLALQGLALGATPASAALRPIAVDLSTAQLNLFREFFPDGAGGIHFNDLRRAFEQFANGELRNPAVAGQREPDGAFFFLFAEFAFLCVDSTINDADWKQLLRVFVQTQELFIHIYRPSPHRTPPRVGAPLPACLVDALGNRLPRRPLDGPTGFSDANFNAVGQSNAARKAALRAKYARMGEAALRKAAQENLLRARCMP